MLLLALLTACDSPPDSAGNGPDPSTLDGDLDGVTPGGGDCDDADPAVFPEAEEICNEVDDDCDGETDEEVESLWFQDADGDGSGDFRIAIYACEQPAGHVADDLDCDDADPARYPTATDTPYDGIDQDCTDVDATCADLGPTYEGNVSVGGSDDISWFCERYSNVKGNIQIIGRTTDDLTGLECLCEVDGGLRVWTSSLTSLHGLEGVAKVTRLELIGNPDLVSLDGLDNLRMATEIELWDMPSLESIQSLESLQGSLSTLQLLELPRLANVDGLAGVGEATVLELDQLDSLTDLDGLSGLESAQWVTLSSLPALASVAGLFALTDSSLLTITGTGLPTLEGLGGLSRLDELEVADNSRLATLAGLSGLTQLARVSVHDNDVLADVEALHAVGDDAGQVLVYNNGSLGDLSALVGVVTFDYLHLSGNAVTDFGALAGVSSVGTLSLGEAGVTSLSGLSGLTSVGTFELWDSRLASLEGMVSLTKVSDLQLADLPSLNTLEALSGLDLGDLGLYDLDALPNLYGLEGWEGGSRDDLTLDDNDLLLSLEGLESVAELRRFVVTDNPALANLDALAALGTVDDEFAVEDNPFLPTADVEALCVRTRGDLADCTISGNQ